MAADDAAVSQEEAVAEAPELGTVPESNGGEPDRAEAAVAEKSDEPKTVIYKVGDQEAEIQLPPKLYASTKFRIAALDDDDPRVLHEVRRLLTPEMYERVMDTMDAARLYDEDEDGNEEAMTSIGKLLNDAMAAYGLTAGESQASTSS